MYEMTMASGRRYATRDPTMTVTIRTPTGDVDGAILVVGPDGLDRAVWLNPDRLESVAEMPDEAPVLAAVVRIDESVVAWSAPSKGPATRRETVEAQAAA